MYLNQSICCQLDAAYLYEATFIVHSRTVAPRFLIEFRTANNVSALIALHSQTLSFFEEMSGCWSIGQRDC